MEAPSTNQCQPCCSKSKFWWKNLQHEKNEGKERGGGGKAELEFFQKNNKFGAGGLPLDDCSTIIYKSWLDGLESNHVVCAVCIGNTERIFQNEKIRFAWRALCVCAGRRLCKPLSHWHLSSWLQVPIIIIFKLPAIIINHCTLFAENSLLCVAIDIISALHVVLKTHPENVVTVTMELIATMSMDSAIVSRDIKGRRWI